jgi:UDPglucose 6-dehydrogenase
MPRFARRILCIGAGHVGGPTMAVIAARCPECEVTVVDVDGDRIRAWQGDNLPIYEPGLLEVVKQARGRNLFFSTDVFTAIDKAEVIFVSVNTPTKTFGEGAGKAPDLQYWEKTARTILEASRGNKIVVEKSTLPVRTAQAMERILNSNGKGLRFEVLSNPEFLSEGTAIRDLERPDRVLIGSHETPAGLAARDVLVEIYARWVPREQIVTSDIWSAELSKLASNAFLAQRISSINSISAICERTAADVVEVSRAIGLDGRIGKQFLEASVGFGGSCFKKDILNLVYLCESYGLDEVARYWESVVAINDYQKKRFVQTIVRGMFDTVAGKRIALLGFAFKKNTADTRESAALAVARKLIEERAVVVVSDPKALANARADLRDAPPGRVVFEEDPSAAARGSHALVVLTEWDLYRSLNYRAMFDSMEKPAFLFDGRNLLDHEALHAIGFNVYPVGKPPLRHF